MRSFSRFIMGVIFGGFLGSTIVLLFAPESGQETRDMIVNRFQTIKNQFEQAMQERRIDLEKEIESYKEL